MLVVLSELWYDQVASNVNTFFLSWKQRTAVKVVENTLQYIKKEFEPKLSGDIFKNVEEQVTLPKLLLIGYAVANDSNQLSSEPQIP